MDAQKFRDLLIFLANAWNNADINAALDCFTSDAVYMQPPDAYIFKGYEQLEVLFSVLHPEENFTWPSVWIDSRTQTGAGGFSFKIQEAPGVVSIQLKDEKIWLWREYQWQGCLPWNQFI